MPGLRRLSTSIALNEFSPVTLTTLLLERLCYSSDSVTRATLWQTAWQRVLAVGAVINSKKKIHFDQTLVDVHGFGCVGLSFAVMIIPRFCGNC